MPAKLPPAQIDDAREREIARLIGKGLQANAWRPDFAEWSQRRIWAERHQGAKIETLERWTGPVAGKVVLDLGTGRGGLAVALQFAGAKVAAIDLRRRNCRVARLRAQRYGAMVDAGMALGEALPFRDGTFDLVICKDVTEHSRDPQQLLGEIARVLARGGAAYVTFINRLAWDDPHYHIRGLNFLPRWLAERVIDARGRTKADIRDLQRLSVMHYYTVAGARGVAERAGLEYLDVSAKRIGGRFAAVRRFAHERLSLGAGTLEAVLRKSA